MKHPRFIHPIKPKVEIKADAQSIARVLKFGWWGQTKIHGHRAQVHIHREHPIFCFTKNGTPHKASMDESMVETLQASFSTANDWTVLDCEWQKRQNCLYVFDVLKHDGRLLHHLAYRERRNFLNRFVESSSVQVLGLHRTIGQCLEVLSSDDPYVEGLVFRSPDSVGFNPSSIIRCRKAFGGIPP